MARNYEFGNSYTPEQAYKPSEQYKQGSYWSNQQGGSAARPADSQGEAGVPWESGATLGVPGQEAGLRSGQIMSNMREAETGQASPLREGFQASSDGGKTFSEGSTALNNAQANAMGTALKGQNQALMDYKQGYADQVDWMNTELRGIQAQNEQKADSRKKGGGLLGGIATIAGSLIGGPIGAGVGALGSLFG